MGRHTKSSGRRATGGVEDEKVSSIVQSERVALMPIKYLSKREVKQLLESDDEVDEIDCELLLRPSKKVATKRALSLSKSKVAPHLKKVTTELRQKSTVACKSDVSSDISDDIDSIISENSDNENILNVSYISDVTRNVRKTIAKSTKNKQKYQFSSEELAILDRQKEYFRKVDQHELHISE